MNRSESIRRTLAVPAPRTKDPPRVIEGTVHFLTPVFGGGVHLDEGQPQCKPPDRVTPVRSASVRGQLREWWRRTCGFDSRGAPLPLDLLRDREAALWGWASTDRRPRRGWVSVEVDASRLVYAPRRVFEPGRDRWKPSDRPNLAYGTFPLQPTNGDLNLPAGELHDWRGAFVVRLRAADGAPPYAAPLWNLEGDPLAEQLWREVQAAWEAWATFGGFGGRTRRGFGAVQLEGGASAREVAARHGWRVAWAPSHRDPLEALALGLARLRDFRQKADLGRNPGSKHPGRSRWPEPDLLRRLAGGRFAHAPVHPVHRVPRAAFGLPIVFHFQSRDDSRADAVLQPIGAERLASPVLIRPVADGDGYRAVALRLPQLDDLDAVLGSLTRRDQKDTLTGLLTAEEQAQISPLERHRGQPSSGVDAVLDPFFRFFEGSR